MTKYQAGARVGEYLLEKCLGAGTFGEVWQARHHIWDNERVAAKLPTEAEYVRYLQREGVVVHGIRHPNIVRVIGLDPFCETPYLLMELVKGPSLRDLLREHPKGLPIPTVLLILRGLLKALAAAHEANVVHRDLKPGNVLLNLDGRPLGELATDDVKVGDFGLGFSNADTLRSMVEQSASIERDRQSSEIAGTLVYMAPELREGTQNPGPRSDLYSLGVVLFEMLTGERPAGAELPSTLRAETPAVLDEIFRRLYARFDNRFADAAAVLQELDLRTAPLGRDGRDGRVVAPAGQLVVCPECREPVEPDDQFCTQCGVQLAREVRRCPACSGYPGPQDRFCIFCGAALAARE
ncbi:MAG: serine/threonine-protein kinase [Planctomycetota bacterium]